MKFSIIIPVYNGEEYLSQCFDNISELEYEDLEIIFVNDGSTDKSKSLIENFATNNEKVIFINKELNGGTGSAYRLAFNSMTGDYVSFTDCDDLLFKEMYDRLEELIVKYNKPDMIHFGAISKKQNNQLVNIYPSREEYVDSNSQILDYHYKYLREPVLGFRIVRKELFKDIFCPDQATAIDEILTAQLLIRCKNAYFTKSNYFTHIITQDSVSRKGPSEKKIKEEIYALRYICDLYRDKRPKFTIFTYIKYVNYLIYTYDLINSKKELIKQKILIREELIKYYKLILEKNGLDQISLILRMKTFHFVHLHKVYPYTIIIFRLITKIQYTVQVCYQRLGLI